eukprot:s311_g14.t1
MAHSKDKFQRSDLDAIENGILQKVKEKRQVCHVSADREPPRPKSAATLTTEAREVRGSKSEPQLATLAMAPKPQLLKPPDCFDLWREFDSMQHASEEAEKRRNKQAQAKRYLEALNEQLQQAQARKDAEVLEKQRDRHALVEEVQRSRRNASAELQKKQQKKQLQKEAALDLLARVEKQKGAAVQRLQVAKIAMDRTLEAEERHRQEELLKQQKQKEDESLLMRRQYESSQAAQQDSKQKEKEADTRLASEWKRIASKPPEAELPGGMLHKIRENQKRVDTLVGTMGVALVQKQRAQTTPPPLPVRSTTAAQKGAGRARAAHGAFRALRARWAAPVAAGAMPRRRSPSRSDSRRRSPPRKSRKESRSRSRRGRDGGRDGRDGRGDKADEKLGKPLPEWGTIGIIQELKPAGIGFIRPHSGKVDDKDLFFHKSALKNSSFDALAIGDECTYEAVLDETKGKAAAKNIVLKNGNSGGGGGRRGGRDDSRDRRRR